MVCINNVESGMLRGPRRSYALHRSRERLRAREGSLGIDEATARCPELIFEPSEKDLYALIMRHVSRPRYHVDAKT